MKGMYDNSLNSGTPSMANQKKATKTGRNTTYNARSPIAAQNAAYATNHSALTPQQQQVQQEQLNNLNMI